MAKRERKKNPCVHCEMPFEAHEAKQTGEHFPGCSSHDRGPCDCAFDYTCNDFQEQRIFRISPSSAKSYGQCIRKWAARALGGIKKETPSQIFGTNLHGHAEHYLLTGEVPDQTTPEGRLFVEGIPYLPKRRLTEDEVEGEVSFTFQGVPWIGYYDWKLPEICEIGDHKSSSDPKRWGLTGEDLPNDVQACMYAYGSGWDETRLKWLYYSRKSHNAFPVEAIVTRSHAQQVLEGYTKQAKEMSKWFYANPETLTIDQLNEFPNDPKSCDMCGRGCDFAEHCTLIKPSALVRKKTTEHTQMANSKVAELQAKIAAKKAAAAAGKTTEVNPPESAAALEDTAKEVANEAPSTAAADSAPTSSDNAPEADAPKTPKGRGKSGKGETLDSGDVASAFMVLGSAVAQLRKSGLQVSVTVSGQ